MTVAHESDAANGPQREGAVRSAAGGLSTEDIWKEPAARLLARLETSSTGLDTAAVQSRLASYGPNNAGTVKRTPLWLQFLSRFRNPLVIILLVASVNLSGCGYNKLQNQDESVKAAWSEVVNQ